MGCSDSKVIANQKNEVKAAEPAAPKTIDYIGGCFCGAVEYEAKGEVRFNFLCHCRHCSTGVGMCPVHLCAVVGGDVKFLKGADKVKTFAGNGSLRQTKCTECGCALYQGPEGAPFKAYYPRQLKGYVKGKDNKYPADLAPTAHINYENRVFDWADSLPKYSAFPSSTPLDNAGNPIESK